MSFNAAAILIVRTGGSDNNGGGFNPANANMATDGAATSATGASPVFSSASYNFVAGDVGARIFIKSGTNWIPGWYTIASVASNQATLTASAGNATLFDGTNASGVSTANGCATTGSPTGATWTVDYSNQDAAEISYTDMVIGGTTTQYTSAGNPVGKNIIGNYINVTSGTGFTVQRVEVVSTSGTTATCDKSLGTGGSTGGNGALGGALASPGKAGGIAIGGNDVFIASGTYTITSSSSNVAAGRITATAGTGTNVVTVWEGFGTIPRDMGTPPVISAGAVTNITIISCNVNYCHVNNITVDGNSASTTSGITSGSSPATLVYKCKAQNCTTTGLANGRFLQCVATGCVIGFNNIELAVGCESYANTSHGFVVGPSFSAGVCVDCLSYGNTGASTDGFVSASSNSNATFMNCSAYSNGRHGFFANGIGVIAYNCIAEANSGYGFSSTAASFWMKLVNCGAYNNTSGAINTANVLIPATSFVTNTTGSFFTNAGSNDFSLNNTASQGALARGTGFPGVMPRGTSTGYADLGAIQHQDSGGNTSCAGFFM